MWRCIYVVDFKQVFFWCDMWFTEKKGSEMWRNRELFLTVSNYCLATTYSRVGIEILCITNIYNKFLVIYFFYKQLPSGRSSQSYLYFCDFQSLKVLNGCLIVWSSMQIWVFPWFFRSSLIYTVSHSEKSKKFPKKHKTGLAEFSLQA